MRKTSLLEIMGTVNKVNNVTTSNDCKLGRNFKTLEQNDHIKELQTIIRDRYDILNLLINFRVQNNRLPYFTLRILFH